MGAWDWTQETSYLAALLRTRGDVNMSREQVPSYLDLQAGVAGREMPELLGYFNSAREALQAEDWDRARESMLRAMKAAERVYERERVEMRALLDNSRVWETWE